MGRSVYDKTEMLSASWLLSGSNHSLSFLVVDDDDKSILKLGLSSSGFLTPFAGACCGVVPLHLLVWSGIS